MQTRPVCLIAASLLSVAALAQQPSASSEERVKAAIAQTLERFLDAWNKHDAHAFAMAFTEDADFTNVQGIHARGRANVEAFHAPVFASIFKDSHQTATIRSIRMLARDIASVDVDWEMTGARNRDGTPRPDRKGLLDWIMVKQPDGTWLIEIMHNTELTDHPAPTNPK